MDYFILVYVAAMGVLQMIASRRDLRGMLLIPAPPIAFLLGLCAVIAAFTWFFASEPRNLSDTEGGLDGNRAASMFSAASALAVFTTLVLSICGHRSLGRNGEPPSPGLDALGHTTYLWALRVSLKALWNRS